MFSIAVYRALDIANYVVHYALESSYSITHLQLQKILYFIEANHLVIKNEPIFNEDIEKWKLGPVVESVYHQYKVYGSKTIGRVPSEVIIDLQNGGVSLRKVEFNPNQIDSADKVFINGIVDEFIVYSSFELVDMTHEHELWYEDEEKIIHGLKGLTYDKNEMKLFFEKNPHLLRG